jgi:excisionase family DNA binding protein
MKIALTVQEVAEMLGLSTDCVYGLVRQNQIPHVRAGRRILFHRPVLESWLCGETSFSASSKGGSR